MDIKNMRKKLGCVLGAASLLLVAACEAPVDDEGATGVDSAAVESPQAAEADAPAEADGPAHARHPAKHGMHAGGPMAIFRQALETLDLSDAQRAQIDELVASLRPDADADRPGEAFQQELATAVRAGNIDDSLVAKQVESVKSQMAERRAAMTQAVQKLHSLLSSEQRSALASSMRERMDKMGPAGDFEGKGDRIGKRREHGAKDAKRGERGERLGKDAKRGERGERFGKGGPLGHLLKDLDLSDAQREQLREAMQANRPERPDPETMKQHHQEMKTRVDAMLSAFASDTFDAAALAPDFEPPVEGFVSRKVEMLRVVLPILDEGQRAQLADRIAEGKLGPEGRRGPGEGRRGPGEGRRGPGMGRR